MITADTHVHTSFSSDSEEQMEAMVLQGIKLGLERIYFTDHMDFDFPKHYPHEFIFDVKKQQAEINRLKEKYKEQIHVFRGIELGLQPHIKPQIDALLSENTFDYIIGSIHIVDGMDPYYSEYWERYESEEQGILNYFETALECVEKINSFDSFGHLDYIIRYAPSGVGNYSYQKYADIIDAILKRLIDTSKALEMNTSGYRQNGFANPHMDIIKRFFELGGDMLTIGSDGHETKVLAANFDTACKQLKENGLQCYTTFEHHKPLFHSLIV